MKRYFDAIIVIPLEEEFVSATESFAFQADESDAGHVRYAVRAGTSTAEFLLVKQARMGRAATEEAVTAAVRDFDTSLLICAGIAGGISNDLNIGDVCFTGTLIDVTDNAKVSDDDAGSSAIALSAQSYETPVELVVALNRYRLHPATRPQFADWQDRQHRLGLELLPGSFSGKSKRAETLQKPVARDGSIACGLVSGSAAYNRSLKGADRKVLAIETESGGLFAIAKQLGLPAIAVRGISDYADADKTQFEADTSNHARKIAAGNAFSFLVEHLQSELVRAYLTRGRERSTKNAAARAAVPAPPRDLVSEAVVRHASEIEGKLKTLLPSYSAQAKGYRLPVPRIRVRDKRISGLASSSSDPIEIAEALRLARVTLLHVPQEYPDRSLSWAIGHSLLTAQIDGRQVVPIVIEAHSIQRPRGTVTAAAGPDLTHLMADATARPVIIIDDFDFDSKTKTDFLTSEIEKLADAHFLICTRSKSNVVNESRLVDLVAAATAGLCEISFAEMSFFLRNNFDIPGPASEVIASRLRDTFKSFQLPSHPTYFAGIPPSTLSSLLDANRRAELIEIAVVGYLSFVVHRDEEPISLSRKTREMFLAELAYEQRVRGREFSEQELVALADQIARQHDFRISPTRFVAAFIDRGILHFVDGSVRFTLPFIESFLLAKRAAEDDEVAKRLFAFDAETFDHPTFTLYAELGVSQRFREELISELDASIEFLTKHPDSLLLSDRVRPAILNKGDRVKALQKRLEKAAEDVRSDLDKSHEKQRLLDATDQVRERIAKEQDLVPEGETGQKHVNIIENTRALLAWRVAVGLLGAGAERLQRDPKRALVGKILRLSSLIIDDWTRYQYSVDYDKLRTDLKANDQLVRGLAKSAALPDLAEARQLIESLIDLVEFGLLTHPLQQIAAVLCEEARDKVLAESIVQTVVEDQFDNLLKGLWLSDIDTERGRGPLSQVIKDLPAAPFLRLGVASHLVARVYWKHWKQVDRLSLLSSANDILKRIGRNYNRAELKRMMQKEGAENEQ